MQNRFRQLHQKRDYYAILEIDPTTPDNQVEELAKKNFKKLALKYHPDRNPEDKEGVIFKALSEAKDVLTDSTKRAAYKADLNPASASKGQSIPRQTSYAPRARPQPGWTPFNDSPKQASTQRQYPSVRVQRPQFAPFFFIQPRPRPIIQDDILQALLTVIIMDALMRAAQQHAAQQAFLVVLMGMQRNAHHCRAHGFQEQDIPQQRVRVR